MIGAQMHMFAPSKMEPERRDANPDGLRDYQEEAVASAGDELSKVRATMVILATGLGKTRTASAIIRRWIDGSEK